MLWHSRWAPHFAHGLGYPIFNYVPPLTGFLTAGLSLFGLDMQDALKLVATGTVLAGALGTYLVARRFLAAPAAAVAGAAYALAPTGSMSSTSRATTRNSWRWESLPSASWGWPGLAPAWTGSAF